MQSALQPTTVFRRPIVPKSARPVPPTPWPLHPPAINLSAVPSGMSEFIDLYHPAVRAFIGSIVRDSTARHELAQKFFLDVVMQGQLPRQSDGTQGRFHERLKQAVRDFLVDERRLHLRTNRRVSECGLHSDRRVVLWDGVMQTATPAQDSAFLRGWAQGIVQTALRQVAESFKQKGKQQHFRLFIRRFLAPVDEMPSWRSLGEPFDLDEKTARNRAETAARQVRAAIRQLIATERGSAETVDEEMRELISLF